MVALLGVHRMPRVAVVGVATVALVAGAGGSTAYALATAATPHTGAIPSAGPAGAARGGPGGMRGVGRGRRYPAARRLRRHPWSGRRGYAEQDAGRRRSARLLRWRRVRRRGPGGAGGILGSPTPGAELTALLVQNATDYTWVAAAVGSNNAAGYQLATGAPVMAVGGFNGTDPAPTLAQFQALRRRRQDPLLRRRRR